MRNLPLKVKWTICFCVCSFLIGYEHREAYSLEMPNLPSTVELSNIPIPSKGESLVKLSNKATKLLDKNEPERAESLFKQAQEKIDANRELTNSTIHIIVLNGLGLSMYQQLRFAEAEQIYKTALKLMDESKINDNHLRATLLNNLGQAYRDQSKYEPAEQCYKESITLEEGLSKNANKAFLATVKYNLGLLYCQEKRYKDSEPVFTEGMVSSRKLVGPKEPGYMSVVPYYREVLNANGHDSPIPGI